MNTEQIHLMILVLLVNLAILVNLSPNLFHQKKWDFVMKKMLKIAYNAKNFFFFIFGNPNFGGGRLVWAKIPPQKQKCFLRAPLS